MRVILYAIPILMFMGFLVMSGVTAFKFISEAEQAGKSGKPFMAGKTQCPAIISGFYMTSAIASLSILGLVPNTGSDNLTVIACFALPSIPLGMIVAIGNYLRAKQAFELAQKLSRRE